MLIKFKLSEHNEWDREIINWLKEVPRGYRPALIKQKLYEALNNKDISDNALKPGRNPTHKKKYDQDVDEKIEKLLNF